MAEGVKVILAEEGYKVNAAMTGQKVLESLSQEAFDLFLADPEAGGA